MLQHPARRNDGLGESGAGGDSQLHSVVTLSAFLPVWCSLARVCRFKAGFAPRVTWLIHGPWVCRG